MNRNFFAVSMVLVLMAGCGQQLLVASRYVKSTEIGPSGGLIQVSQSEEPLLAGAKLEVPATALSKPTRITLEIAETAATAEGVGPVALWGPADLAFSVPARMTLPLILPNGVSPKSVYIKLVKANGEEKIIRNAAISGGAVSFDVGELGAFQASVLGSSCPSQAEICNGLDDDCDGVVDEGCVGPDADGGSYSFDAGRDQYVDAGSYDLDGGEGLDGGVCAYFEACNGVDDDCDGVADEGCGGP